MIRYFMKNLETFSGCMFSNSIYYVIVCLCVCFLHYSLSEIRPTYWHLNFWMRYFWHLPGMFVHQVQINTYFFCFCQSDHWFSYIMKLGQDGDISTSECNFFLKVLEIFLGCFYTSSILLQNASMCLGLFVALITFWNKANRMQSPLLNDLCFWHFLRHSQDICTVLTIFTFFCIFVSLFVGILSNLT